MKSIGCIFSSVSVFESASNIRHRKEISEIFGKMFYPVRIMQKSVFCFTEQMFQISVLLSEDTHI